MPRVFLITGTSTGFGKHLVEEVLARGDIAVATARKPDTLKFKSATDKNFLAVKLDVTSNEDIEAAFTTTLSKFKRVDVVVNNAGYGLSGVFEELSEEQTRKQMEVNFFGLMAVTRKAMSVMREQSPSGGFIQQVTSIGGQRGVPLFSIYCASNGPWRVLPNWAGRSMEFPEERHEAYDHMNAKEMMGTRNGKQAGDPIKGAKAMYELAVMKDPPLRVVIGTDAYKLIMSKLEDYKKNYTKYEKLSNGTDIDGSVADS